MAPFGKPRRMHDFTDSRSEPIIVGCDYHPSFQQIAYVDIETGEWKEQRLEHRESAEAFSRELASRGAKVPVGWKPVGTRAGSSACWRNLVSSFGWGCGCDPSQVRSPQAQDGSPGCPAHSAPPAQAGFSQDLGTELGKPRPGQLLWHRHRMVQARTRLMNQLQAVALNEGLRCKKKLWREKGRKQLEAIRLAPWASRRRQNLLQLLDGLNPTIAELTQAIDQEIESQQKPVV
jgi:transposase